jgi:electron transport complex protein RnfG
VTHAEDKKNNSVLAIALNLGAAGLLSGLIIAAVYFITAPVAAEQRIVMRDMSMKALVPTASEFHPVDGHAGWFMAMQDGKTTAYIVPGEGKGYGGSIKMLVAADPSGTILGYKVLSHNETPGLGDRTTQPKFRDQFTGKKVENLEVVKVHEDGKIDAITGVTISSRAVTKAVKEALTALNEYTTQQGSAP